MNNEDRICILCSMGLTKCELLSTSMKVSRGGIIMKSHCCDVNTYNRKVGLFLRNARVSFIMQSTVIVCMPSANTGRKTLSESQTNGEQMLLPFVIPLQDLKGCQMQTNVI